MGEPCEIYATVSNSEYGYWSLVILVGGQIVNTLSGSVEFIMLMTGHQRAAAVIVAGAVAIILLICFLLVPSLGALGGAIATTAGTIFFNFVMVAYVMVKLKLNTTVLPTVGDKKSTV